MTTHLTDSADGILRDPVLNRGTGFDREDRRRLRLAARLPSAVETPDEQAARCYEQLSGKDTAMAKYIYLDLLHDATRPVAAPVRCPCGARFSSLQVSGPEPRRPLDERP